MAAPATHPHNPKALVHNWDDPAADNERSPGARGAPGQRGNQMTNGTLKELTPEEIARIVYNSWLELVMAHGSVAPWQPFDSLPEPLKALEMIQIEHIIGNIQARPHELHAFYRVTGQKMIRDTAPGENIIANLEPYMIPFTGLDIIRQTRFRLQVQLTRTLLRHNRNVKRAQKR